MTYLLIFDILETNWQLINAILNFSILIPAAHHITSHHLQNFHQGLLGSTESWFE